MLQAEDKGRAYPVCLVEAVFPAVEVSLEVEVFPVAWGLPASPAASLPAVKDRSVSLAEVEVPLEVELFPVEVVKALSESATQSGWGLCAVLGY